MDNYTTLLKEQGLTLVYAIATHTHADHITACFSLREQLGCEYVMSTETASLGVSMLVDDEEKIMLGSIPIQFHAAPGHTNDSMIVHVPGYMMTGDFLFNGEGGVGRDDLPSGRVHVHWDALSVLDRFEGHTIVCSGHDPPGTTMMSLDWNRANNPILSMTSFETFRAWQEATAAKLGGVSKSRPLSQRTSSENCQRPSRGSSELISSVGSSALWCLWEWWGVLQFFKRHLLVVG